MGNAASIAGAGGHAYPIRFEGGLYRYANEDLRLHSVRLGGPVCSSPGDCRNMAALAGGHTVSPTIVSSRPHYSNEIEGDTFSQRIKEQGHEIVKRSPIPGIKTIKTLPLIPAFPISPLLKPITGPLLCGSSIEGAKFGAKLGTKFTLGLGAPFSVPTVPLVAKKFCLKLLPKG